MNYIDPIRREIARFDALDILLADVATRIQLPPREYQKAVGHYETMSDWIDRPGSPLEGLVSRVYPQGGFAIGATIARHETENDFDIDGMAELAISRNVDPDRPLAALYEAVRSVRGSRYYDKAERKTRCVTVNYVGVHLDLTPTVLCAERVERTGLIFHSKVGEAETRRSLWANPYGFAEWFNSRTPAEATFGVFFEERSLQYDQSQVSIALNAEAEPVPDQLPAYRKSRALIALQLIKRWRNLVYGRKYPNLRLPPSVLLAHFVAVNANRTSSLAEELLYQIECLIAVLGHADMRGMKVHAVNEACPDDILTDRWPGALGDQRTFISELRLFAEKVRVLRRGVPLPQIYEVLEELFGERPARGAVAGFAGQHEADRIAGNTAHMRKIGGIPALGAAFAAPAAAHSTPKHTFYGD
jgi:hypothetical protein